MTSARKNFVLVARHHRALLKCWCLLLLVRLTLTFRGYKPVLGWIRDATPTARRALPPHILIWVVQSAAPLVPAASCLTRALTLRLLLAQASQEATIEIGVKTDEKGKFHAHAWVTLADKTVAGEDREDLSKYKTIVAL